MFKILDGRSHFWQWDLDQKLVVEGLPVGTAVQFYNGFLKDKGYATLVRQDPGKRVCDVPNILLQRDSDIKVYAYVEDDKGSRTVFRKTFTVKKREKPAAYSYTETATTDYPKIINEALAAAKRSGMFDGAPGKDGRDGVNGLPGAKGDPFTYEDFTEEQLEALKVKGDPGKDGTSPLVMVSEYDDGSIHVVIGDQHFTVRNGKDGQPGPQGEDYVLTAKDISDIAALVQRGVDGKNGQDGISPTVTTETTEAGTIVTITDVTGVHTFTLTHGVDGKDGVDGIPGADGKDGITPEVTVETIENGATVTIGDKAFTVYNGKDGEPGPQGIPGEAGKDGEDYVLTAEDLHNIAALVPPGQQGPQGVPGPQGEDYVLTAQDMDDIAALVLARIPNGDEVAY